MKNWTQFCKGGGSVANIYCSRHLFKDAALTAVCIKFYLPLTGVQALGSKVHFTCFTLLYFSHNVLMLLYYYYTYFICHLRSCLILYISDVLTSFLCENVP